MKHLLVWLVTAIVVVMLAIGAVFAFIFMPSSSNHTNSSLDIKMNVTEANFPVYLASTSLVSDLPSDASILLKTETKTYAVQKGTVVEGTLANPDIIMTLPSSYITQFSNGFCATVHKAYAKGDLGISLNIGSTSAAWKYRALLKYKSCIGI
jgi:hypothetical protein